MPHYAPHQLRHWPIPIRTRTVLHTQTHTHLHTDIRTCMCACMHAYRRTDIQAYGRALRYSHRDKHSRTRRHKHVHTQTRIQTRTHTRPSLSVHMHMRTHSHFFMHFCPGTRTTHAESVNSDLHRKAFTTHNIGHRTEPVSH